MQPLSISSTDFASEAFVLLNDKFLNLRTIVRFEVYVNTIKKSFKKFKKEFFQVRKDKISRLSSKDWSKINPAMPFLVYQSTRHVH